jgi:hypothetical protein
VQREAEALLSGKPVKEDVLMEGAEHEVRNPSTLHLGLGLETLSAG